MKDKKARQEQLETPIADGDTRPDQQVENTKRTKTPDVSERPKVTKDRGADIDRADDFRDAKS
jgi:hypothetical protein